MHKQQEIAIIIGAGPAGLTAAYELVQKTNIKPIILEMGSQVGGLCKTINYKGYRMDIGGHRFFSKSEKVMEWWNNILPVQGTNNEDEVTISYQNKTAKIKVSEVSNHKKDNDKVMLIRNRVSRIYFLRKFFDYPVTLGISTVKNLGFFRTLTIVSSYIKAKMFPISKVESLEDFYINRFGKELYRTFFKDYTEKVWGVPCDKISAEWGAQRIKGLSFRKIITHALYKKRTNSIKQGSIETSLIERFLYPKFGPGQMWEEVAKIVMEKGGEIRYNQKVSKIRLEDELIKEVVTINNEGNTKHKYYGDYFISTMPVKDLIDSMTDFVPNEVQHVADQLVYRDFIVVGLLVNSLKIKNKYDGTIKDNWVYIQESDVKLGRLQIFNNWSPHLVVDKSKVWMGLEYFCNEGDSLWSMDDNSFMEFAVKELEMIGFIDKKEVLDSTIVRELKTYPSYFGAYDNFGKIRSFVDSIPNLFLVGRNGMHRYNNQDHSMLTAMEAVDNIITGVVSKGNIWNVNVDPEYHEEK